MAENKRQSLTGRPSTQGSGAAGGPGMAAAMVPLEVALSGAIGARVRITTAPPTSSTLEGTLFTACPITNLVAINTSTPPPTPASATESTLTQAGDYHIVPISRIQSFQLLSLAPSSTAAGAPCFTDATPSLHALDIRALKNREATAVGKLQELETKRGKGVTREGQDLFDAFSRTMPAHWDGTSIIVADAVAIASPYRVEDCQSLHAGDTAALARVRKVLEMERKKIELRSASATMSTASSFPRSSAGTPGPASAKAQPSSLSSSPGPGAAGQRKGG
ncbi:hypothetical protein ASPZODRAFT_134081 [Penicilliopsis zonata CBS 506.65]|uniref:AD domain-containing protein n=1 Tax=Penicilliopsis zonata CBS 506.65 TaxID=1073090 RepID=A0A1L9SE00_9EURO|nr:hypothetical protein ASPZODRAFT_134081 [Penicilliopsis zonata CBS 506.65]OJJ45426.1 hypothetical protein ASPZODRAFT_134081 [Penicilliopsis zonata CBS 506.65]